MVAGLTADVFVQLTATLAQLSLTLNKTKEGSLAQGKWPVILSQGDISSEDSSLPPIPIKEVFAKVKWNASIPCPDALGENLNSIRSLDWICAGCRRRISDYDENENLREDESNGRGLQYRYQERRNYHRRIEDLEDFPPTPPPIPKYELTRIASFGPERILRFSEPTRMRVPLPPIGNHRTNNRRRTERYYGLYFIPLGLRDEGDYTCIVNGNLRPSMILRLKVQAPPDAPGKPLIMAFTAKSVNLSWTPPLNTHHSPVHHYLIHIRVGEKGSWNSNSILTTDDNSTVFRVLHLQPFTTYSFKVSAVNDIGTSEDSKESYYTMTLRTKPTGKVTITSAHNTSSMSIRLTWRSPPPSSIHGEFLGYRIAYRKKDSEGSAQNGENVEEIYVKDHRTTEYELNNLEVYEEYFISVQVYNPEGLGPAATVVATTDEGVPSMPVGVKALEILNSSITLEWAKPLFPNGVIQGYRLYFMRRNFTDVQTVRQVGSVIQYFLSGLEPFTRYRFWVKAFTWKNEGEPSKAFEIWSDVQGPSPPVITNLTCRDLYSVFIQWDSPKKVFNRVDYYFVYYQSEDQIQYQIITIDSESPTFKDRKILITNLTTDTVYTVQLRAGTLSIYDTERLYKGEISVPQRLHLRPNCDTVQAFSVLESGESSGEAALRDFSTGILAGLGLVVICIIVGVVGLILKRRYGQESYYYVGDNGGHHHHHHPSSSSSSTTRRRESPECSKKIVKVVESLPLVKMKSDSYNPVESEDSSTGRSLIPKEVFRKKCSDNLKILHKEFEAILEWERELRKTLNIEDPPEIVGTRTLDRKENGNRYSNVIAYEHTRVKLEPLTKKKSGSEFLNANYIDGYDGRAEAYVATQGPLPASFGLFWRMVWEKNVNVIVMMTNLIESGKKKCDQYWPSNGMETYGPIEVTFVGQEVMAFYTIRSFRVNSVKKSAESSERLVLQYHYTHWPDHGTPINPWPVLNFVKKSSAANQEGEGPAVVHCSAGVGRTGAYIFIDSMLKQIRYKGGLDPIGYLTHIRTQRMHLVQTPEQYIFAHRVIREAVSAGETNVHRSALSKYVKELQSSPEGLDFQFRQAVSKVGNGKIYEEGTLKARSSKIRRSDFYPDEESRVRLKSSSSDFINASWIPGFNRSKEFILTQHPTEKTLMDFWKMVWDCNVQTVVVISAIQPPTFGIFWPTSQTPLIDLDSLKIKLTFESSPSPGIKVKTFNLLSLNDDFEFGVKFVFCPAWPHSFASAPPLSGVCDLVRFVLRESAVNTPTIIVDAFGGLEGATFCSLSTLLKQLESEHHVDVYSAFKTVHSQRPGAWKSPNELLFIYRIMEAFISEPSALGKNVDKVIPP